MADRLLRVHIQSPVGLWAWMTLSYNMGSVIVARSVCTRESGILSALANVVSDWCIAAPVAVLALVNRWRLRVSLLLKYVMLLTRERMLSTCHEQVPMQACMSGCGAPVALVSQHQSAVVCYSR